MQAPLSAYSRPVAPVLYHSAAPRAAGHSPARVVHAHAVTSPVYHSVGAKPIASTGSLPVVQEGDERDNVNRRLSTEDRPSYGGLRDSPFYSATSGRRDNPSDEALAPSFVYDGSAATTSSPVAPVSAGGSQSLDSLAQQVLQLTQRLRNAEEVIQEKDAQIRTLNGQLEREYVLGRQRQDQIDRLRSQSSNADLELTPGDRDQLAALNEKIESSLAMVRTLNSASR